MSQKNFQIFRSQISDLKTDNVDYLKKPPWKKNFFDIFAIHLTSRYEKRCQTLQRLFSLFQGSKNQLWGASVWAVMQRFEERKSPVFWLSSNRCVTAQTEASRGHQRLATASKLTPHKIQYFLITTLALEHICKWRWTFLKTASNIQH